MYLAKLEDFFARTATGIGLVVIVILLYFAVLQIIFRKVLVGSYQVKRKRNVERDGIKSD